MTDAALSIQMEELILTLQTLTEHQQEQLADSKAQSQANEQFTKQITEMIKPLISLLKTYQAKEQFITENTSEILKKNINDVFTQNQSAYHATIIKGFNQHIDTATKHLSIVAVEATQILKDLETAANNSKTEFESRQEFFKLYEDTYDKQSRELKKSVDSTLTDVLQNTKDKLDFIGTDFSDKLAKNLSWKVSGLLGTICILIMVSTLGLSWLFVPSKADIAERQAQYDALGKSMLLDKVVLSGDSYYARVDQTKCKNNLRPQPWGTSTWCKFQ